MYFSIQITFSSSNHRENDLPRMVILGGTVFLTGAVVLVVVYPTTCLGAAGGGVGTAAAAEAGVEAVAGGFPAVDVV